MPAGALSPLEAARPTAQTAAASVASASVSDRPTSSTWALPAVSPKQPSCTSARSVMRGSWVSSAATSAAFLEDGLVPADHALIAMRWWPSLTFSLRFAPLRLRQGGDQPNLTTIDNNIASNGIAGTNSVHHHRIPCTDCAELTVRFQPFRLYEFAVIRSRQRPSPDSTR